MEALAQKSCEQVQQRIIDRGDKLNWTASFDGFYLTRGHHSNNCSATLHDHSSDKICWFAHRTKRGKVANWQGTSGGAEGDMLRTILEEVKAKGFNISQIIMDHDTKGRNIACSVFPEVTITYCGNHTVKSFHHDKINLLQGKNKHDVVTINRRVFISAHHHVRPKSVRLLLTGQKKLSVTLWQVLT